MFSSMSCVTLCHVWTLAAKGGLHVKEQEQSVWKLNLVEQVLNVWGPTCVCFFLFILLLDLSGLLHLPLAEGDQPLEQLSCEHAWLLRLGGEEFKQRMQNTFPLGAPQIPCHVCPTVPLCFLFLGGEVGFGDDRCLLPRLRNLLVKANRHIKLQLAISSGISI